MQTPFFTVAWAVLRKDLRAEARSRELIGAMGLFALMAILVYSFALELNRQARAESVSGVLWVTLIFASILGFNRSLALERDQGNLDALLIAPVSRAAVYLGKLAGNLVFMIVVAVVLLPLMTVLFNITLVQPLTLLVVALGSFGFASVGTLLAAMTVQTRARESLLPIVMLPIVLPLLLACVRATAGIVNNAPSELWDTWLLILIALDAIFFGTCLLLFGAAVEE
ncbi:cytochrome C biogenesis protein [Anaerolineae bacterium CFX9]|jgi:heme exporter protein B|nr:cytochrome C biogenesis protein [Anaerolineae bacterium CFX9]